MSFVSYQDGDVQLEGYLAYERSEKKPLVILCHAWMGRDDFICEKTEWISQLGYVGFALDVYGKGILAKNRESAFQLKKPFIEDRLLLQKRLLKGYETACSLDVVDTSKIAVLGFGFGGLCALDLASSGVSVDGAITVYGHFDGLEVARIKAKILILHGHDDPISTIKELGSFQQELSKKNVDWQACIYENTKHAFLNPTAVDYNPEAAKRAWSEIEKFLREIF